ncbi:2Fe-2S iron-sulfur cluster-binding protein [Rubrivivax albus]|uniref:2Fe-2S iron-sulfur cluster binding domain-containing protein n=1 Tax=Rubrivivax albus TaxID=2499835 RepID=A0A437K049_9BURK|nr:2Fe-2S iron-sulfur cluster-binding protein [Rubrivivax albus]RVT53777.1 2Fe-2S iron-sulfur cluster binding domain-containing protein [Rubrivivax albus]
MPDITFIEADGEIHAFEAPEGVSLMAAATGAGVPGIVGECGGQLRCATCHVVVDPAWVERLPPPSSDEQAMLALTAAPCEQGSRLSCQVMLTGDMQGLVLRVPASQY